MRPTGIIVKLFIERETLMLQQILAFATSHQVMLAGVGVAILDLIFALQPTIKSNGVAHWIYLKLQALVSPAVPPSA